MPGGWGALLRSGAAFFSTFDCCFLALRSKEDPYNSIMSGFCTGAVLASRGGSKAAMQAGMVGGIILAVIEGLNIALVRMFSTMGPPDEPITMGAAADGNDGQTQMAAAEQPWWAKLIAPPPPPPDVDFSDPKEMQSAPGFGEGANTKAYAPLEPRLDAAKVLMLMRAHCNTPGAISQWRSSFLVRRPLQEQLQ